MHIGGACLRFFKNGGALLETTVLFVIKGLERSMKALKIHYHQTETAFP